MDEYQALSHTTWDCKYHVVFIPKCCRKTLYFELTKHPGEVFHKLAMQKESRIEDGHLMPDHVHMMVSIPPTVSGGSNPKAPGFAGGYFHVWTPTSEDPAPRSGMNQDRSAT